MNIIIVANFPGIMDGSFTDRFCYLAKMMHEQGHNVELVVSDFCHDNKTVRENTVCKLYPFKVTLLHEDPYIKNVSIQRLKSHFKWGKQVRIYLKTVGLPDIIYCAIPSLTVANEVAKFCKRNEVKFVIDLQDLWPEAFAMAIPSKLLQQALLPMKWYVDASYRAADLAVAVSDTYVNRILTVNKKISAGLSVYLGNDGEAFDKGRKKYQLERNEDEIVVGYIGNMSTSYDMPCVMDALAIVKERGYVKQSIRFVLVGGGVDEDKFKEYAKNVYPNTTFLGRKSYQEMAGLLCGYDIVVNPIVKGSVASIINKVGDYALSGKPVVNTQESIEYRKLVDLYECGINCECGNAEQVADAIEKLALDSELRSKMGKGAARLGRERFDRRYTYPKIVDALEQICKYKVL